MDTSRFFALTTGRPVGPAYPLLGLHIDLMVEDEA